MFEITNFAFNTSLACSCFMDEIVALHPHKSSFSCNTHRLLNEHKIHTHNKHSKCNYTSQTNPRLLTETNSRASRLEHCAVDFSPPLLRFRVDVSISNFFETYYDHKND